MAEDLHARNPALARRLGVATTTAVRDKPSSACFGPTPLATLSGPTLEVASVVFSPDGRTRWHDAEHRPGPASPRCAHTNLRHSFAFMLAAETGSDAYELQRRLGHGSQRYIDR